MFIYKPRGTSLTKCCHYWVADIITQDYLMAKGVIPTPNKGKAVQPKPTDSPSTSSHMVLPSIHAGNTGGNKRLGERRTLVGSLQPRYKKPRISEPGDENGSTSCNPGSSSQANASEDTKYYAEIRKLTVRSAFLCAIIRS